MRQWLLRRVDFNVSLLYICDRPTRPSPVRGLQHTRNQVHASLSIQASCRDPADLPLWIGYGPHPGRAFGWAELAMRNIPVRPIVIDGPVAYVTLTKGLVSIIDTANAEFISKYNWLSQVNRRQDGSIRSAYAKRSIRLADGSKAFIYMHKCILYVPDGFYTDHINGNGLDNRIANLRLATLAQNHHNCRKPSHNTSGAKGVYWDKRRGKWSAQINVNRKHIYIGLFSTIEEASEAYANASKRFHGEFGRTS